MAETTGTQAIDRAAQLLVRVVESPRPPSVGELAERAGLPKSTTSRLVSALERQGLVQRLGDRGRLTAGPRPPPGPQPRPPSPPPQLPGPGPPRPPAPRR